MDRINKHITGFFACMLVLALLAHQLVPHHHHIINAQFPGDFVHSDIEGSTEQHHCPGHIAEMQHDGCDVQKHHQPHSHHCIDCKLQMGRQDSDSKYFFPATIINTYSGNIHDNRVDKYFVAYYTIAPLKSLLKGISLRAPPIC